ncbi:MAG TPA: ABC transporter permease [Chloroflexi bacterium]|nr:ABC transporter permease [Chloroflexota bacterium]
MIKYILRRLAQSLIVMLGVSVLAFGVLFLSGDPTYLYVNERASAEAIEQVRHNMGFDRPVYVQYWDFLTKAVRGDFGMSLKYGQPAMQVVLERLPATIELTMIGMFVAVVFAIPVGVIAAAKRNTLLDGGPMLLAMIGQSMPEFWLGLMLILVVGVQHKILPISGRVPILEPLFAGDFATLVGTFPDALRHLILPGVSSGVWSLSRNARLVRSSMLEVLGMDYVTTARAKGVKEQLVVLKHAFKNALIPIVTIVGMEFGFLLSGDIVIENIFAWPGIGRLVVFAINQKDFNVVQASVIVLALLFVGLNLLVDILYTWLDPRIRYS